MTDTMFVTQDQLKILMNRPHNVRHVSIIGEEDPEMSILQHLVFTNGVVPASLPKLRMDCCYDDHSDLVTLCKPSRFQLLYGGIGVRAPNSNDDLTVQNWNLINLSDTPSQMNYFEVATSLRVTDSAVVIIDAVEGVSISTEHALRNAVDERIKLVYIFNNLDHAMWKRNLPNEEIYMCISNSITSVNSTLSVPFIDPSLGELRVLPEQGNVVFGSGAQGWGFTLQQFARLYAKKFGTRVEKLVAKLWGDWFFDPTTKKWQRNSDDNRLVRGFCQLILDPITRLRAAIMQEQQQKINQMIRVLGIVLTKSERELPCRPLFRLVMRRWLSLSDAVLNMIVCHLPSSVAAQAYRVETLYNGPLDDEVAAAVRTCDPTGPVCMYVSNMVLGSDGGGRSAQRRVYAFGRVFSGTVQAGQKVRVLGPQYVNGGTVDLVEKRIQRMMVFHGRHGDQATEVPAGNVCTLVGMDAVLERSGTVTSSEVCAGIRTPKSSVTPLLKVFVECKRVEDVPRLIEGLKWMSRSHPSVVCSSTSNGEHVIATSDERRLNAAVTELRSSLGLGSERLVVSDPFVMVRETVRETCARDQPVVVQAPGAPHVLKATAGRLSEGLSSEIEAGIVRPDSDPRVRARYLADTYEWDIAEARKIWAFGPDHTGANLLVDFTRGVSFSDEMRLPVVSAFQRVSAAGPLLHEPLIGVQVNLVDVVYDAAMARDDAEGDLVDLSTRAINKCLMAASPTLLEPVYMVHITCRHLELPACYTVLVERNGEIVSEESMNSHVRLRALVSVVDSIGLGLRLLNKATAVDDENGSPSYCCVFDHWREMSGSVEEEGSSLRVYIDGVRARRGLAPWRDTSFH